MRWAEVRGRWAAEGRGLGEPEWVRGWKDEGRGCRLGDDCPLHSKGAGDSNFFISGTSRIPPLRALVLRAGLASRAQGCFLVQTQRTRPRAICLPLSLPFLSLAG